MERETLKSTLYKLIRLGYTIHLEGVADQKMVKATLSKQNSSVVTTIMPIEHLSSLYDNHPLGEQYVVNMFEVMRAKLDHQ